MPATKEKIIDRINVTVLGTAKKVLTDFQVNGGYSSQGDALSDLLLDYKKVTEKNKEIEAKLAEAKKE